MRNDLDREATASKLSPTSAIVNSTMTLRDLPLHMVAIAADDIENSMILLCYRAR